MGLHRLLLPAFIAATAVFGQTQQGLFTGDPNNPNGPSNANNQSQQNLTVGILAHGSGADQDNIGPFATIADKQFAQLFYDRAGMQIEMGKMALQRGTAPQVKLIAQRMVDDYSKWQMGLTRVSARLEIKLPAELSAKRKARVAHLASLTGSEFDQQYLVEVARVQNRALTATQYEAANAGVTGFRNWAGLLMPTLEEHLMLTKSLPLSAAK